MKSMKKVLILFFLTISIRLVSAQNGFNYYNDSSRVGSPNKKAYTYFKKAYYDCIWTWTRAGADSAEHYLKLAIQEDPDYSAAYAFLAHVYQFKTYDNQDRDNKFALEKKYAQKAISFNPKTGDAFSVMSDVVWTEHDTVQALNLLRTAIKMEPDNVGNYLWIATRYYQMGQENYYDSAIYSLHHLLQIDPEYGQAYMKLGNVYHRNKHLFDSAKFYYHKAIDVYNNVTPRDNRMMFAYTWIGEVYEAENKYDSAIYYYNLFLKEMEPSDMYIRDMLLSSTYKALNACHKKLSDNYLNQFLKLNESRIARDPKDVNLLADILEGSYMNIEQDSIYEKYALPLAKHLQTTHSSDAYVNIFAVDDEFLILKKLKRNKEAIQVLEAFNAKNPKEPLILFELGRMKILEKSTQAGFAYLKKAKLNLNNIFKKQDFVDLLSNTDFDKVRDTLEFKKLVE